MFQVHAMRRDTQRGFAAQVRMWSICPTVPQLSRPRKKLTGARVISHHGLVTIASLTLPYLPHNRCHCRISLSTPLPVATLLHPNHPHSYRHRPTRSGTRAHSRNSSQHPPPCRNPFPSRYLPRQTRAPSGPPKSAPSHLATHTPHQSRRSSRSLTATLHCLPQQSASFSLHLPKLSPMSKAPVLVPARASSTSTKQAGGASTNGCA
jgi:hypothetical protein